jgi:rare lipoprotein A
MPDRRPRHLLRIAVLVGCCASLLVAPAATRADATGGAIAPVPGALSLVVSPAVMLGRTLHVRGIGARAGAHVTIQRLDSARGWLTVASAETAATGTFLARWRTNKIGRLTLRALVDGVSSAAGSATDPTTAVTVYRPALATWYGPGFYGHRTACGVKLTRKMLGVAHPTLPCGTQVDVWYGGRSLTVPVIDRGPFAHRASWDLTAATAKALGFVTTDRIGAVALRATN